MEFFGLADVYHLNPVLFKFVDGQKETSNLLVHYDDILKNFKSPYSSHSGDKTPNLQ